MLPASWERIRGRAGSSGRQRLALLIFGALFVVLFAGFAIAQGIGEPSVPSGDVAIVEDVPDGNVSEAEYKRAPAAAGRPGRAEKTAETGREKIRRTEERGAERTPRHDLDPGRGGRARNLGHPETDRHRTRDDQETELQNRGRIPEIPQNLSLHASRRPRQREAADRSAARSRKRSPTKRRNPRATKSPTTTTRPRTPSTRPAESRDIRIVVNKDKAKAEEAKALLDKDDSDASWEKVAAKYSTDPSTKGKGGLQVGLTEELLGGKEPLSGAIFDSSTGEVVGPVDFEGSFFVVEVDKLNPEKIQPLAEVSAQIKTQLTQQPAQEAFSEFVAEYQAKWKSRTFCAADFLVERCSNFVGSGHPTSAPPTCYEADPKGGTPKECPAPVAQAAPAFPGSVTIVKPQGERLPQRPQPEGLKEAARSSALPEGVAPGATAAAPKAPAEAAPEPAARAVPRPSGSIDWRARERDRLHPRAPDPRLARQPDRRGRGRAGVRRPRPGGGAVRRLDRRVRGGRAARRRRVPGPARASPARSQTSTARSPPR